MDRRYEVDPRESNGHAAHILTVNWDEMPNDKPREPAYEIFSIKHRF